MDSLQNPLVTRDDLQNALHSLLKPLEACRSPGYARIRLGETAAHYPPVAAEMEGFCRPLWGVAPLIAGGGYYRDGEAVLRGLVNGTDPTHPEFWGVAGSHDQRLVEMAALAVAICLAPQVIWDPLTCAERTQVVTYLAAINACALPDNNWHFFRVLVNLALHRVGACGNAEQMTRDLQRLESYYLPEGGYSDGPSGQRDYYVPFAMHYYGLLYASLAQEQDPVRCDRFRQRAAEFAQQFIHWFAADGSALPYGRSLIYRFAQGAFWGALAFAGVEALPWGMLKGLLLRHLRWWLGQPIATETGLLTLGYAYPNLTMTEQYNSPTSPYWAFKAFLPLALSAAHPFWQATEQPLPDLPRQVSQPHTGMILCRDPATDHVLALAGGKWAAWGLRHGAEKYAKFCYSNRFGFSVPSAPSGLDMGAHDSMLALSEEGEYFRVRRTSQQVAVTALAVRSTWQPWPDVWITTWLIPAGAWHVRVHWVQSNRRLISAEGGFALSRMGDDQYRPKDCWRCTKGLAQAIYPAGVSAICDIFGRRTDSGQDRGLSQRAGQVVCAAPNTNLLHPRTVIPTLVARHAPGRFWLACAVLGIPGSPCWNSEADRQPTFALTPAPALAPTTGRRTADPSADAMPPEGFRITQAGTVLFAFEPSTSG
jgi:hypothetical protein